LVAPASVFNQEFTGFDHAIMKLLDNASADIFSFLGEYCIVKSYPRNLGNHCCCSGVYSVWSSNFLKLF